MLPLQQPGYLAGMGLALTLLKLTKVLPFLAFSKQVLDLSVNRTVLNCGMARRKLIEGRQGQDCICH